MFYYIVFIIFAVCVFSFFSLAPRAPTRMSDLARINKIIKLKEKEKFLEIGCGTANVSIFLAKENKKTEIVGIELSPFLYFISKIKSFFYKGKNLKIIYGNALNLNLSNFDAIYIFGMPETISKKLSPKIQDINNKNFRLISYCFQMNNKFYTEKKYKREDKLAIYEYKKLNLI